MDINELCNKSESENTYVMVWFNGMNPHTHAGIEFENIKTVYEDEILIGYALQMEYTVQYYNVNQIVSFAIVYIDND